MDPSGKTAFITGGTSGIGLGMAHVFLEAGLNVVIAGSTSKRVDEALDELEPHATRVHAICFDASDARAWPIAADEAEERFGPIDILCNNAGIAGRYTPTDTVTFEEWSHVLNVNLNSVFLGSSIFAGRMKARNRSGYIVNTTSVSTLIPRPEMASYISSKAAIFALSEVLHQELKPFGIGVSILCTGSVRTRLFERERERQAQWTPGQIDSERLDHYSNLIAAGLTPLEVGVKVLEGIKADQLYIMTHPDYRDTVKSRFDIIVSAHENLT